MKNIFVKNKFLSRAISALALILVSGVIFACKNDAEGESSPSGVPNGKTVKAITATAPSKNQYSGDENFQSAGIVVKAIYEDDSQGVLSQDKYTITPPDFDRNASGTNTYDVVITLKANAAIKTMVSVTYSKAELTLSSIEVVTKPSKLTYFVGDAFDKSGMVVRATYSDGSSNTITPQSVAVKGENDGVLSQAGTKTVTVSHNGKTATFSITVNAVEIVSISATNPTKTSYTGNEEFSPAGIVVTGHKNNGSEETLSSDKYEIANPAFVRTQAGVTPYDVTITLKEKTSITTKVIVTYSKAAAVLKSISVQQNPSKTEYFTGDAFDSTGLEVEAVYTENGVDQAPVPVTADVSNPDMTTSGTKTVTVTFGGKTASFNITVNAICLESISLNTDGVKKAFYTGDMFNSAGLVVNAVYNDTRKNKTVNPTSVTAEGLTDGKFSEDGTKKVTVTYTEGAVSETDEYSVTVNALVLKSIAIKTNPSKTVYCIGEDLNKTGLVATASFNNGTTRDIAAGDLSCDVTKFTEAAESKTVTVSYTFSGTTKKATFTVKVENAPADKMIKKDDKPIGFAGMNYVLPSFSGSNTVTVSTRNALMSAIKGGNKLIYIDGMIDMSDEGSGSKLPEKNRNNIAVSSIMDDWINEKTGGAYRYYSKFKADGTVDSARTEKNWVDAYAAACKVNTEDSKESSKYNSSLYSTMKTLNSEWKKVIQLNLESKTTIIGVGDNSGLRGGTLVIDGKSNIVIRNLYLIDAIDMFPHHEQKSSTASDGYNSQFDCITIQGSGTANIWIDHCTFEDTLEMQHVMTGGTMDEKWQNYDGSCDIKGDASGVTVSNCHFFKHDKTMLIGSDDSEGSNATRKISLINNYFDSCVQRLPMVRNSQIHILNNYYDFNSSYTVGDGKTKMSYGIGIRSGSRVYSQGNYFASNINAAYANEKLSSSKNNGAGWYFIDGDGGEGQSKTNFKQSESAVLKGSLSELGWTPPYAYTPKTAAEAKAYASENAGHGKCFVIQ